MTYDERQEIEVYLGMLRKDIQRLSRCLNLMEDAVDKMQCVIKEDEEAENAKETFLKQY